MNTFGWGVGDIIAISKLAAKVNAAYKDAPEDYRHISEDVMSLQTILTMVIQHFESTTFGDNHWQECQEVLKSCESVLEDLNSLIVKYNILACVQTNEVVKKINPTAEGIATLRAKLISGTVSLNDFIQRYDIPTIATKYTTYANTSPSAMSHVRCVRCRHSWMISLVNTAQTPPLGVATPRRLTRGSVNAFMKLGLQRI